MTQITCSERECEFNKKGICMKKVIEFRRNFPDRQFHCCDRKEKL